MDNRIPAENAYQYLLSGRANVTFLNTLTGNQMKFKVLFKSVGLWYLYHESRYIGYIRGDVVILRKDDSTTQDEKNLRKFQWVWKQILANTLPNTLQILNHGECGRCHRPLTDAISLQWGIGPECRKILGIN